MLLILKQLLYLNNIELIKFHWSQSLVYSFHVVYLLIIFRLYSALRTYKSYFITLSLLMIGSVLFRIPMKQMTISILKLISISSDIIMSQRYKKQTSMPMKVHHGIGPLEMSLTKISQKRIKLNLAMKIYLMLMMRVRYLKDIGIEVEHTPDDNNDAELVQDKEELLMLMGSQFGIPALILSWKHANVRLNIKI